MQPPRLELRNISRRFDDKPAVKDVSLSLQPGTVTALLGRSGCGKSTTLRIAAGVERQDSGEICMDGAEISGLKTHQPPEARNIGLMFQDFALFPHLNVAKNISFGLKASRAEATQRVGELLQKVSLDGYDAKFPHELSGGEQQRVALARALAPKPKVLLMDEPFSGLDDRLRDVVREETMSLLATEGASVLMVTHDPEEAMMTADQIVLMRDGSVVQIGAPFEMFNHPVDRKAAEFFSDCNVMDGAVTNGSIQTPFGDFDAKGHANGSAVEIVIRPQHIRVEFDRNGNGPTKTTQNGIPAHAFVKSARYKGSQSVVDFTLQDSDQMIRASLPGVFLPKEGTPFWLLLPRDRCFVFAKTS
ncbi:MAG: ABC transporter ATP-binding protein [Pseudomonadota bacterium]